MIRTEEKKKRNFLYENELKMQNDNFLYEISFWRESNLKTCHAYMKLINSYAGTQADLRER